VLIFLVVVIVGALLSNALSEMLSKAGLGGVNRSLGGVFGIIRGVVIITVLLMMFSRFEFARKFYRDSVSIPYLMVVVEKVEKWFGMTPDDKETVRDAVNSA
jgi:membrane protein required for colicin V production